MFSTYRRITPLVFLGLLFNVASLQADGFKPFFREVGKKTHLSEEEVREKAVRSLELSGRYSREDLVRIGKGDGIFEHEFLRNTVRLLQADQSFRASTGLDRLIRTKIASKTAKEFFKFASVSSTRGLEIVSLKIDAAELHLQMHPEQFQTLSEKLATLKEAFLESAKLFLQTNDIPYRELMVAPDGRTVLEIRFQDLHPTTQERLKHDWHGKFRHFWIDADHRAPKPLIRKQERVVVLDIKTMQRITQRTR